MSAWSDFFTQAGFWWGVPAGAIVAGSASSLITARSVRNSDERKAAQEDKIQTRKEQHEQRKSNDQLVREACMDFASVATETFAKAIDIEGLFNAMRDMFQTAAGIDDPNAMEKFAFAETQVAQTVEVAKAFQRVKVVAPDNIVASGDRVMQVTSELAKRTTDPFAKVVLLKSAGKALDDFINEFRLYLELEPYREADSKKTAASFAETLRQQIIDYTEEAKEDMQRVGFPTDAWENIKDRSSKSGPDSDSSS